MEKKSKTRKTMWSILLRTYSSTTSKVEVDLQEIHLLSSKSAVLQRQLQMENRAANETQFMRVEEMNDKLDRHFDRSEPHIPNEGQRGSTQHSHGPCITGK